MVRNKPHSTHESKAIKCVLNYEMRLCRVVKERDVRRSGVASGDGNLSQPNNQPLTSWQWTRRSALREQQRTTHLLKTPSLPTRDVMFFVEQDQEVDLSSKHWRRLPAAGLQNDAMRVGGDLNVPSCSGPARAWLKDTASLHQHHQGCRTTPELDIESQ